MRYHVLFGSTIIASFQHNLHREMFMQLILERFPFAYEQVKTLDKPE